MHAPVGAYLETARPLPGSPDWFLVSWARVRAATGFEPRDLPGVYTMERIATTDLSDPPLAEQMGASARSPFPYKVHRSLLQTLVGEAPSQLAPPFSILERAHPGTQLRPHQQKDIHFIRGRRGTLLASEQRTGKTATIMFAHDARSGTMVVTSPLAGRLVWHEWAARRFGACGDENCSTCERLGVLPPLDGRASFIALAGQTPTLDALEAIDAEPRVLFLHHAIVPHWSPNFIARDIGTLVIDEAHLAGAQKRKNISVEGLRQLNVVASRCIAATGTPMLSKPAGLWPILDLVAPGAFGTFWGFASRYASAQPGTHGWATGELSHGEELRERLREVMLRRTWAEIAPGMPPVSRSLHLVPLTDAEIAQVEAAAREIQRFVTAPQTAVGHLARLRKLFAKRKAREALQLALGYGESTVIWTWHRSVAEEIHDALQTNYLGPSFLVHGQMNVKQREVTLAEAARPHAQARFLVATMGTLGTAVNLAWANRAIMAELDWIPSPLLQAEMRIFDGTAPVEVTYLVADCPSDRRLADTLLGKLEQGAQLGLAPGVGSVAEVLGAAFGLPPDQSLFDLAEAVLRAEAA